ncbi:MAG: biotin--[acetyl-CoA-carboxylase] ligase [Campylobacteraceae bacterium]|nr:biotin--[acetyl-CoA-carboxylase] ligase [Campylobacteraceae bacterium]
MEIHFVEEISSTHQWLCEAIKNNDITPPFAIYAAKQTQGIGSRGNTWESGDGNLYLSFVPVSSTLPDDLPQPSMSIYFSQLLLEFLRNFGSSVWLKWPNDFYIGEKKAGGMITAKVKENFIISVGINLHASSNKYAMLDIAITPQELVKGFMEYIKNFPSWKQTFSKYKLEFQLSQSFGVHIEGKYCSLKEAKLCLDGSIEINNKKVYSLR